MRTRLALLLLALLGAPACSSESTNTSADPKPQPLEAPAPALPVTPVTPVQALMHDHFEKAYEAREHMIRADIIQAKAALKWLAEHQRGDALPTALRPLLADMQKTAAFADTATSLREIGNALAATYARCGMCHEIAGKGPNIAAVPIPEATDAVSHMHLHHWAAQQMFEGLITASAERFAAGATALRATPPLAPDTLGASEVPAADVARLDAHIHELASEDRDLTSVRSRAELYGRVLATCATCHKLMKRGPEPLATAEVVAP